MAGPHHKQDENGDTNSSGARRILQDVDVDDALPPTPSVLANRARITTGRYAIVRPASPPPKVSRDR